MAMRSTRLTQDQNFNVHFDGVKTNGSTVQKKKEGLRGRKALNDISNSKIVIPIGEDLGVSKKSLVPGGVKPQISGKKAQVNGRKALGDLTNSVKPFGQQHGLKKRGPEKKSITVAEDGNLPCAVAQECFLHNHEECIKSKKTAMGLHQFLKTIGLNEDVSCQTVSACNLLPRKSKLKDEDLIMELEEIPMPIIEDRSHRYCGQSSPIFGSPSSPRLPYVKDWDDIPSFILADTPRRSK